jgi:hypothetical protein
MDKRRIMSLLTDLYMDSCALSLGCRTVAYNMGEAVFREYVKEGKSDFTGNEPFCDIMKAVNPNCTDEYDAYDICVIEDGNVVEYAMEIYENEKDSEMRSVLCYGLFLVMMLSVH